MDLSSLKPLLDWITAHPHWAGFAVFAISLAESLAIVGLFIPGVPMMFGIGALVAVGALDLWATLAWAAAGAIVGDGISYWLGYHYKERLRVMWPFRRYPVLMQRGEQFFVRHGGKSVFFGRFVGPVRPIIPVVAGMLGMRPGRFLLVNVGSALAWAPAYMLPGVVFGASLNLASEVASRLAVLLVALLICLWLTLWLVRRIYRALQPHGSAILDWFLSYGGSHRYARPLVASVLDPQYPELRGLAVLAALLVLVAVGASGAAQALFGASLAGVDEAIFNFMQGLRVPWADGLMVLLAELGDRSVSFTTALVVMAWLAWRRYRLALLHIGGGLVFALILTYTLHSGTPPPFDHGALKTTGGIVISTVLYGLLAVMVTQGLDGGRRWLPYAAAGMLAVSILLARLHLGLAWFSKGLAGWLWALLWVVVLGAAYRRHATVTPPARELSLVIVGALALAGAIYVASHYQQDLVRYAPQHSVQTADTTAWWNGGWRELPPYRLDLEGHETQPLTVQWAGTLDVLAAELKQHGWHEAPPLRSGALLQWLRSAPPLIELPLLPQVHDGHHDSLRLVHATSDGGAVVLRLWPSDRQLADPQTPLWVGTVTALRAVTPLPLITVPLTGADFDGARHLLQNTLGGLEWRLARRSELTDPSWDGGVLLIRAPQTAHAH